MCIETPFACFAFFADKNFYMCLYTAGITKEHRVSCWYAVVAWMKRSVLNLAGPNLNSFSWPEGQNTWMCSVIRGC